MAQRNGQRGQQGGQRGQHGGDDERFQQGRRSASGREQGEWERTGWERDAYDRGGYGEQRYGGQYDRGEGYGERDRYSAERRHGVGGSGGWSDRAFGQDDERFGQSSFGGRYDGGGREGYDRGEGYRSGVGGRTARGSEHGYGSGRSFGSGLEDEGSYAGGSFGGDAYQRGGARDFGPGYGRRESQGSHGSQGWQGSQGSGAQRGRFYGKSPQGYTRSDERIREEVCDILMQGHVDPSQITVRVKDGEVILEGRVERREDKHQVENLAQEVLGVKDVENRLKVGGARKDESDDERTSSSSRSGGASRGTSA